jgi:hypothetical protein
MPSSPSPDAARRLAAVHHVSAAAFTLAAAAAGLALLLDPQCCRSEWAGQPDSFEPLFAVMTLPPGTRLLAMAAVACAGAALILLLLGQWTRRAENGPAWLQWGVRAAAACALAALLLNLAIYAFGWLAGPGPGNLAWMFGVPVLAALLAFRHAGERMVAAGLLFLPCWVAAGAMAMALGIGWD